MEQRMELETTLIANGSLEDPASDEPGSLRI
jgi:hypothetical protein